MFFWGFGSGIGVWVGKFRILLDLRHGYTTQPGSSDCAFTRLQKQWINLPDPAVCNWCCVHLRNFE